jgi:c-di-GMP-related signal transduction protein
MSAVPAPVAADPEGIKLRYEARQPIFDREEKVCGYELLFRDDMENVFHCCDPDMASRSTLDSSLLVGPRSSLRWPPRFLKLNSARFGLNNEIHSVRHALAIFGDHEVRRWVRLIATVGACQDKINDLVLCALARARFGELLAPLTRYGDSDLFLAGLLSMLDVILGMPMSEVLEKIPLDSETKAVLRGEPSLLQPIYQLMRAHETGEWESTRGLFCNSLDIDADTAAASRWQSQQRARQVSSGA